MKLEFSRQIFEKYCLPWKFVQWEPSCSMWTDRQTHRHDEGNCHFSQFCESSGTDLFYRFWWGFHLSRATVRSSVKVKDSRLKLCSAYWKIVVCANKKFVSFNSRCVKRCYWRLWCDEFCGSSLLARNRATHNRWSYSSNLSIPVRTLHSYFCNLF